MIQLIRLLVVRMSVLMGAYTFCRLLFLLLNQHYLQDVSTPKLLLALAHGFRFDAAALSIVNMPLIILSLLPLGFSRNPNYQKWLLVGFLALNLPFLWLNVADASYFDFTGRRSTIAVLGIWKDIGEQSGMLLSTYWPLALTAVGLSILLVWHFPRLKGPIVVYPRRVWSWVILPAAVVFAIVCIRGGFQLKPLRVNHAFQYPPAQIGHLTLNSTFTFLKSATVQHLEEKTFFASRQEALQALPLKPELTALAGAPTKKQNIVILILESFAAEYTGIYNNYQGYTPFLDSLARQGLIFSEHYSNGRRSIEALPAILAGIPSLMEEPFITSAYQANSIKGLGYELKKLGYHTSFFHGATNGSMGFSNFSSMAGIDNYYGLNEYPEPDRDFDGSWGIYDEPYLQYFSETLTKTPDPFFASVFTLSSHPPYSIPPHLKGKFPKGSLPIHESIGYTDYALRKFFEKAKTQPWYGNTLFIITADHTQQNDQPAYQNLPGNFRVPLVLFHPAQPLPRADTTQVTQHCDLPPTVMHYAGKPSQWLFGRSVFGSQPGKALLYADNVFVLLQKPYAAVLQPDNQTLLHNYLQDPKFTQSQPKTAAPDLGLQLKAYVQLFYNGLIRNDWESQKENR